MIEYQEKRVHKLFPAYFNIIYNDSISKELGIHTSETVYISSIIGSFGIYTDKELGERSFYQFKEMYALFFGIPREESDEYCLFELDDEKIELYLIHDSENEIEEYSIVVVYTAL